MPIFEKQFYSDSVREDVEIFSALTVSVQAESPMQRKLIYTISDGNEEEFFEIDYRTGIQSKWNFMPKTFALIFSLIRCFICCASIGL